MTVNPDDIDLLQDIEHKIKVAEHSAKFFADHLRETLERRKNGIIGDPAMDAKLLENYAEAQKKLGDLKESLEKLLS